MATANLASGSSQAIFELLDPTKFVGAVNKAAREILEAVTGDPRLEHMSEETFQYAVDTALWKDYVKTPFPYARPDFSVLPKHKHVQKQSLGFGAQQHAGQFYQQSQQFPAPQPLQNQRDQPSFQQAQPTLRAQHNPSPSQSRSNDRQAQLAQLNQIAEQYQQRQPNPPRNNYKVLGYDVFVQQQETNKANLRNMLDTIQETVDMNELQREGIAQVGQNLRRAEEIASIRARLASRATTTASGADRQQMMWGLGELERQPGMMDTHEGQVERDGAGGYWDYLDSRLRPGNGEGGW
ncbi:hypothetical protein B0H63DRAFT_522222 [Podospora didyma]|uniref:Uncharacterized protein n=1 Tax=Podospora didyma TaxID=330526 RepID=A0AAE0TZ39_9PEZI|nr:hypothetical protein B0H63DRAFT_522222 [Podospora didyma]